jgi:hypothetical protein
VKPKPRHPGAIVPRGMLYSVLLSTALPLYSIIGDDKNQPKNNFNTQISFKYQPFNLSDYSKFSFCVLLVRQWGLTDHHEGCSDIGKRRHEKKQNGNLQLGCP